MQPCDTATCFGGIPTRRDPFCRTTIGILTEKTPARPLHEQGAEKQDNGSGRLFPNPTSSATLSPRSASPFCPSHHENVQPSERMVATVARPAADHNPLCRLKSIVSR